MAGPGTDEEEIWLTRCPAPALLVAPDGRITRINPAFLDVIPAATELVGRRWWEVSADETSPPRQGEVRLRVAGQRIGFGISSSLLPDGRRLCVLHELAAHELAERRLATQLAVSDILVGSSHLAEAAPRTLELVCTSEGFGMGALWWHEQGDDFTCVGTWRAPHLPAGDAAERDLRATFPRVVWRARREREGGHPWWVMDLGQEPGFEHSRLATELGLTIGCAVPLVYGGEICGVLELFSTGRDHPDEAALQHLAAVAAQLAQFGQRVRTLEAQRELERRLEFVLANAPILFAVIGADGKVQIAMGAGVADASRWVGHDVFKDLPGDYPLGGYVRQALAGETVDALLEDVGHPGRWLKIRCAPLKPDHGAPRATVLLGVDVSELKAAEAELRKTRAREVEDQRLMALGTLAAGVAHEINNPLTYVKLNLGRLISLERSSRPFDAMHLHRLELLQEAREGADHIAHIVQDLRAFTRVGSPAGAAPLADPEEALAAALRLADHEIRHRARIVREGPPVPPVRGRPDRLAQLFLNLLINAAQAMPEGEAGANQISITTRKLDDGRFAIEVRDTGAGIPPDVLPRIFDPFFTTRPGSNVGLGLFTCRNIVVELGGELSVESEPGHGSCFRVLLAPAPPRELPLEEPRPGEGATPRKAAPRGRVLVVDDDRGVAAALAALIGEHHQVRIAGSGREALEVLRRDPDFDVILCDLLMAEVSGMDVYEALEAERPALAERIVFMTGGTSSRRAQDLLERTGALCLDKPIEEHTLIDLLAERVRTRRSFPGLAWPSKDRDKPLRH